MTVTESGTITTGDQRASLPRRIYDALGRWLCRAGMHSLRFHHQSGANLYFQCGYCRAREWRSSGGGYSAIDGWWLAGNDGAPPAPKPPRGGSSGVLQPNDPFEQLKAEMKKRLDAANAAPRRKKTRRN